MFVNPDLWTVDVIQKFLSWFGAKAAGHANTSLIKSFTILYLLSCPALIPGQ